MKFRIPKKFSNTFFFQPKMTNKVHSNKVLVYCAKHESSSEKKYPRPRVISKRRSKINKLNSMNDQMWKKYGVIG